MCASVVPSAGCVLTLMRTCNWRQSCLSCSRLFARHPANLPSSFVPKHTVQPLAAAAPLTHRVPRRGFTSTRLDCLPYGVPRATGLTPTRLHTSAACRAMGDASAPKPELPKVIIVTGPTGVGKTAVSLLLAEQLGGEVVSADSVQVYKGLDVGSDKLPLPERRGVPHHLLDVCDVSEEYTAGRFHDEGRAAIRDILARGKVPVVAGGTGFYLRFLVEGKPATQKATPEQEAEVERSLDTAWQEAAQSLGLSGPGELSVSQRWEAGVALLGALGDPESMQRIGEEKNNYYRLKRALVILKSNPGKTLRDLDVDSAASEAEPEFDFRTFFLYRPRIPLYEKVDARLQEMVLAGLLDEAAMLLQRGMAPGSNMATSAVGYRQAMTWLLQAAQEFQSQGQVTHASLEDLAESVCSATHRLIRAQMTWFRGRPEYKWLDMDQLVSADAAAQVVVQSLSDAEHQGGELPDQGYVMGQDKKEAMERKMNATVFAARPNDVAAVMQHVTGTLLPALLASPVVQPLLVAFKEEQERERAAEAARVEQAKQERLARKAAAKEMHRARNQALGIGQHRKKQNMTKQEDGDARDGGQPAVTGSDGAVVPPAAVSPDASTA